MSFIGFNKYDFLHQLKTNSAITQSIKFVLLIYSIHKTTQLFTHIYNIYLLFTKRLGKTLTGIKINTLIPYNDCVFVSFKIRY